MVDLSRETEALARRLATAQHLSIEDAVRQALEDKAVLAGLSAERPAHRRRLTVGEMLAVGDEIAAMPLLDPRSPDEIMDDIDLP